MYKAELDKLHSKQVFDWDAYYDQFTRYSSAYDGNYSVNIDEMTREIKKPGGIRDYFKSVFSFKTESEVFEELNKFIINQATYAMILADTLPDFVINTDMVSYGRIHEKYLFKPNTDPRRNQKFQDFFDNRKYGTTDDESLVRACAYYLVNEVMANNWFNLPNYNIE